MPREVHIGPPSRGQVVVGGVRVPVVAGEAGGGDAVRVRPAGSLPEQRPREPGGPDAGYGVPDLVRVRDSLRCPVVLDVGPAVPWRNAIPYADAVIADAGRFADGELARAAAERGIPVGVRRPAGATLDEWLAAGHCCTTAGAREVLLCEGGAAVAAAPGEHGPAPPDVALLQRAREHTDLPVLVDLSTARQLAAAAVVAGADGIVLAGDATAAEATRAAEAATLAAFGREVHPRTLDGARQAIDQVDACLADVLERRARLAALVQRLKPVGGFAGRDPERERELVATMARRAPRLGLARIRRIMAAVIEAGLDLAESGAADENSHAAAVGDARSGRNVGRSSQQRDVGEPNIPRAS